MIADDLAGTGTQLTRVVDDAITRISSSSGGWRENLYVVVAAAISATEIFVERDDVQIETLVGVKLGNRHLAFDEGSEIFESVEDFAKATDIFDAIGRSLSPKTPRGFGDLGLLAATESNCPNNAPPMFWKSGEYAGRRWMPLLERRL